MCGIVGYVGLRSAPHILLNGLRRLEYRGYDSAGIACCVENSGRLDVVKCKGKVHDLEMTLQARGEQPMPSHTGIGHTRWATHGEPNEANAHPHLSRSGSFAVVHNGIIENYLSLKSRLEQRGITFSSQTDSEVIVHLLEENDRGDLRQTVNAVLPMLEGTYGLCVIGARHPGELVTARKGSPIAIGLGDGETLVASDVSALVTHTNKVLFLDDGEWAWLTAEDTDIRSRGNATVVRPPMEIDWDVGAIEKGGYEHFMLKEIFEQPEALANTIRGRLLPEEGTVKLSGMQMSPTELAAVDRLVIAACGTSLYAGMVGKYLFEDLAHLPAEVEQAAEFRYRNPIIRRHTAMLAISQSGETADTLAAVREGMRKGAAVLGICNVVGSTIAREAGRGVYLHAGPEIGVASTKAFTCQVTVLAMMALLFGRTRRMSASEGSERIRALEMLPDLARRVLEQEPAIRALAERYAAYDDFFYIGRGYLYPAALEGALKLKEISYIHAEGYHAAELKHGPIALLTEKVPVVAAVPDLPGKQKILGNLQECAARKAPVIAIATAGDREVAEHGCDLILIPPCPDFIAPIPVVIATQLFAYHVARCRGCEIDQPRNLAKSVTVE